MIKTNINIVLITLGICIIGCNDYNQSDNEVLDSSTENKDTVRKYNSSNQLISEYVYNGDKLLYFDEFDSTGKLVKCNRTIEFILIENSLNNIKGEVKIYGKNHIGRDTIMVSASEPFKKIKDYPNTGNFLIWPNEQGKYIYEKTHRSDTGSWLVLIHATEFNFLGSKKSQLQEDQKILDCGQTIFKVTPELDVAEEVANENLAEIRL